MFAPKTGLTSVGKIISPSSSIGKLSELSQTKVISHNIEKSLNRQTAFKQQQRTFILPWVRDDNKKPTGGRGSSINIEDLSKPLENERTGGKTSFNFKKPPVAIPFISLKNFNKTSSENIVTPQMDPEKSKLRKQQSDLVSNLPNSKNNKAENSPKNEKDTDVSSLLKELEEVKAKYQESLRKKIERDSFNSARALEDPFAPEDDGDELQEEKTQDFMNKIEMEDFSSLYAHGTEKLYVAADDFPILEEIFDEEFGQELKEEHKEELYIIHEAAKVLIKEVERKKLKTLRFKAISRFRKFKKRMEKREIAKESLLELQENGFISHVGIIKDAYRNFQNQYGENSHIMHPQLQQIFDETAVAISLNYTYTVHQKIEGLIYLLYHLVTYPRENPDFVNLETDLAFEKEIERREEEKWVQEAAQVAEYYSYWEKTGKWSDSPNAPTTLDAVSANKARNKKKKGISIEDDEQPQEETIWEPDPFDLKVIYEYYKMEDAEDDGTEESAQLHY